VADTNSSPVMHDAEHYILEVQHRERWAAEDQAVDARLDELPFDPLEFIGFTMPKELRATLRTDGVD